MYNMYRVTCNLTDAAYCMKSTCYMLQVTRYIL